MVPSLPLLSCESSVSVKENPDRQKNYLKNLQEQLASTHSNIAWRNAIWRKFESEDFKENYIITIISIIKEVLHKKE